MVYKIPADQAVTLKAQYGGNNYVTGKNSTMFGAAAETTAGIATVGLVFNTIKDNAFKEVEAGPMYTDWQQGYTNQNPMTAYGAFVMLKPVENISIKAGAVKADADKKIVGNKDDFVESNLDAWWIINKNSKLRVRFSERNHTSWAEKNAGAQDSTDFRVAYYLSFSNK